jgi:hypothetical protein
MAPPRTVPTPEEALVIKRRCAETVVNALPELLARVYFGTSDPEEMRKQTEEALSILDDSYTTKRLLFGIIELVIVRLIPELAEKTVGDLMDERLG